MNLDRKKLLEQTEKCLEEAKKFRDFERDKQRGYTSLSSYYTILARIARHPDKFPSNIVEELKEAEEWAEAAASFLRSGNRYQYSLGLDYAELAKSIVSLAKERLRDT